MSLPRKDVKVHFDAPYHAAIRAICDRRGLGLGEFIEQLVCKEVDAIVHDCTVLADEFRRAGIAGNGQESPGTAGDAQE